MVLLVLSVLHPVWKLTFTTPYFGTFEDGSRDAGDNYRVEGREKKEKETDLFYGRLESFLSAITASFIAFFTPSFSNPTLNPP